MTLCCLTKYNDNPLPIGLSLYVFYITCNDISVIYLTAQICRRTEKKLYIRSDSQRHRYFAGFFKLVRPTPTRALTFLHCDSDTSPHLVAFYDILGIGRTSSRLTPPAFFTPGVLTGTLPIRFCCRTRPFTYFKFCQASVMILAGFGPEFNPPFRWRSKHQTKNHSAYQ